MCLISNYVFSNINGMITNAFQIAEHIQINSPSARTTFVFSILSHSSPRFQPLLVGSAPKAPLEGELSAKQTERSSQICCDLSVSASPSHLPWEGRLWTRAPHSFPYEGKATAHTKAALPLAEPLISYAVRRFLPAQVTRARPRALKMART